MSRLLTKFWHYFISHFRSHPYIGELACYSIGWLAGTVTIDSSSCLGSHACYSLGYDETQTSSYTSVTIGSNSCTGTSLYL